MIISKAKVQRISLGLAGVLASGALLLGVKPAAAKESSRERNNRIATYALGAGTAYALVRKKGTLAAVGAAGTAYTYSQWKDAVGDRHADRGRWGRDWRDRDWDRRDRDWDRRDRWDGRRGDRGRDWDDRDWDRRGRRR